MARHKILYHASPITGLTTINRANETPRFAGEDDYVFATPYKAVAAMFLASRNLNTEISKYGDKFVIFINASLEEYKKVDKGGSIYEVDGGQFKTDTTIGMGETEWVCDRSVDPLSEEAFGSSLQAMKSNQVEIYFLDNKTFTSVRNDPSNAMDLVSESSKLIQ